MKKIFPLSFAFFSSLAFPLLAFAQAKISPAIPGMAVNATSSPGAYVAGFYQFALMIGGVLAFGAIVYGGVLYAASAGNAGRQSEGKEWIKSALLGLFLLAAAYLVLSTINPNLVNLNLPSLQTVSIQAPAGGSIASTGCAGGACSPLPNCTPAAGVTNCGGAAGMVDTLNCINATEPLAPVYTVNEGYPPIGAHSDPGHNDGCAVDVHVSDCASANQVIAAAQACGAGSVLNEYTACGGKTYSNTSGGNIHIGAKKGSGGC